MYVVVPLLIAVITLPDDVKETELVLYPKPWLWFCICPACQLPASLFPPSAQARKGAPLFENSIGLKGFSPCLRPFRNWVLGQSKDAGEAYTDTGRALTGEIGADATMFRWLRQNVSGAFAILNTPKTGSADVQSTYEGNYSVNFDAARVWGAAHSGMEFAPPHIWQPIILYLGRPA